MFCNSVTDKGVQKEDGKTPPGNELKAAVRRVGRNRAPAKWQREQTAAEPLRGVQALVLNTGLPGGTYPARRDEVELCGAL
jgi:hypothetical protein